MASSPSNGFQPPTTTGPSSDTPGNFGPNNKGCDNWYTGTDHPDMTCRASALASTGWTIVLRNGTWNGDVGFGWQKAYYYHNLWTKPILDTIHLGNISGQPNRKGYTVAYYYDGELEQIVWVVADTTDTQWGGFPTQDDREVGVLTGWCDNPRGSLEPECPGWVDDTL